MRMRTDGSEIYQETNFSLKKMSTQSMTYEQLIYYFQRYKHSTNVSFLKKNIL